MYFVGASLLYAPELWFHVPIWTMPVIISGITIGLLWLISLELLDNGVLPLVVVALMISLPRYQYLAFVIMQHTAMIFLGVLMIFAWLRWRRAADRKKLWWIALLGAASGWAAVTRPADAVAYAVPIILAVILEIARQPKVARAMAKTALMAVLAGLPFITLQLVLDWGVSGKPFTSSYQAYTIVNSPDVSFGFTPREQNSTVANTLSAPKQAYEQRFSIPETRRFFDSKHRLLDWWNEKQPIVFYNTLLLSLLIVLLPAGLLAMNSRSAVFVSTIALFTALYIQFPFMLVQYPMVIAPAMCFLVVLGISGVSRGVLAVSAAGGDILKTALPLALLGIVLPSLVNAARGHVDKPSVLGTMDYVNEQLPHDVQMPAVVLVRFREFNSPHQEPVYNNDVLNPDDAPIIKAHDLGPDRDGEIIRYYAQLQPQRRFYLLDRGLMQLAPQYLGTAGELAAHLPQLPDPLVNVSAIPPDQRAGLRQRNDLIREP
jgi:hypothetical protein